MKTSYNNTSHPVNSVTKFIFKVHAKNYKKAAPKI